MFSCKQDTGLKILYFVNKAGALLLFTQVYAFYSISFNQMLLPFVGDITINEHNESVYLVYQ